METRMLRAVRATEKWLGVILALSLSLSGTLGAAVAATSAPSLAAPAPAVAVQYRLLTEFAGSQKSGGRILVTLINRSPHELSKVTVRLADPAVGKLTGPVQESVELAAGEARQLEGEFVLDSDVVNAGRPLDWIVIATEAAGFAQQTLVHGELLQSGSMDADAARTATR
jgi:hypothetical protein